jgi:sarcosine oxidase subunit beta
MRNMADVIVVGGGVIGCSVLYHLCRRDITNAVLLEQDVLGSGATGRSQTICRTHYSNPITAIMSKESLQVFKNFDEIVGGDSGFVNTGYVVIVKNEDEHGLEHNIRMQQELGINTSRISLEDMKSIAPMIHASEDELLAWEPESGYADSYLVTTSFANRARDMGAQIRMREVVKKIEISSGRVTAVETQSERIETETVVIATGPWSKEIFDSLGMEVPLATVRHQIATIARPVGKIPSHPIVGDIAQSLSLRPEGDSLTLIGFGEDPADLKSYNQGVDLDKIPGVLDRIVHRLPDMDEAYFRGGWSGLFTITPDWHPIIDQIPGVEGLYCAVGFSGHGFKLAPSIGSAVVDLITGRKSENVDIRELRLNRFSEGDTFTSSYKYNVLA